MMKKSNLVSTAARFPSSKNVHISPISKPVNSIMECIGHTPLVKLCRIPQDHGVGEFNFYVKCEYLNPGGSIKDRIGYYMTEDAKKNNAIQDRTFLECTSGNTGIAVVMNAAVRDHKSMIITTDKCSDEKLGTMRLMGADIVLLKHHMPEISSLMKFLEKDSHENKYLLLDQFENDMNPKAHFATTGPEVWDALPSVDAIVMGAGTGGTLTGTAAYLKSKKPSVTVVAADIEGSICFHSGERHPFLVEGIIGGSYPPITLDKSVVDAVAVVSDKDSFLMARELAKKEGILCGGSAGMAMAAAVQFAKKNKNGKVKDIVVILPDGIRNYMSKFVTEQWMEAHFFQDPPKHDMGWYNYVITESGTDDFIKGGQVSKAVTVPDDMTLKDAWGNLSTSNLVVVVDKKTMNSEKKNLVGVLTADSLRYHATNPTQWPGEAAEQIDWKGPVSDYMEHYVYTLPLNSKDVVPKVGLLSRMLDISRYVVLGDLFEGAGGDKNPVHFNPAYIATAKNVLKYIHAKTAKLR